MIQSALKRGQSAKRKYGVLRTVVARTRDAAHHAAGHALADGRHEERSTEGHPERIGNGHGNVAETYPDEDWKRELITQKA